MEALGDVIHYLNIEDGHVAVSYRCAHWLVHLSGAYRTDMFNLYTPCVGI